MNGKAEEQSKIGCGLGCSGLSGAFRPSVLGVAQPSYKDEEDGGPRL